MPLSPFGDGGIALFVCLFVCLFVGQIVFFNEEKRPGLLCLPEAVVRAGSVPEPMPGP